MILLKIIFVAFIVFNAVPSLAAEWVHLDNIGWYFDKSNIKLDRKTGDYLVWQKYSMRDSAVSKFQVMYLYGKLNIDYSNYSHSILLRGVNCKYETLSIISVALYDKNNEVFFSYVNNEDTIRDNLLFVTPGSVGESFSKAVCKFVANQN